MRRLMLAAFLAFAAMPARADGPIVELIAAVKPSVVAIGTHEETRRPPDVILGTGFAVGDGGHILTALHVVRGAIQLVELDIRPSSPTFGQHISIEVSDENGRIVWIPPGFANGFCAVSEFADVVYHCTELYNVQGELSVQALDPALGIEWCEAPSVLSLKDVAAPTLAELTELLRSLE